MISSLHSLHLGYAIFFRIQWGLDILKEEAEKKRIVMEERTSIETHHKTLIVIVITALHTIAIILIFFVLVQDFADTKTRSDIAQVLSQSPHEDAQVLFFNEPGSTAQMMDRFIFNEDPALQKVQSMADQTEAAQEPTSPQEDTGEDSSPAAEEIPESITPAIAERPFALPELEAAKPIAKPKKKRKTGNEISGNLTLGDIARGFIKSMHQEKGANPGTMIDSQELARQRYGTRVYTLLRHSYHATRVPTHLYNDISTGAVLVLTIKKDGTLANVELQHPNKTLDLREIESLLAKAAKTAGLYPPIPQQFNVDTITLSFPLGISCSRGVHLYDFGFR